MKISQRELILGVAALALILTGATWYVVDGKIDEWNAEKTEIANLKQQIVNHQTAIRMRENWKDELDELQKDLRSFQAGQRSVSPDLRKIIQEIAGKHELDILRSNPHNEKQIGDLYELGINCQWQGKLESIVGFLTELQQQGIRYDVRSLNIVPIGRNTGKLKGNMVINCVYTRKAEAE